MHKKTIFNLCKDLLAMIIILCFIFGYSHSTTAMPILKISSITCHPGSFASLQINIANINEPYAGINAKLILPDGVDLININKNSNISEDLIIKWHSQKINNNNNIILIAYTTTNDFNFEGSILTLYMQISQNISFGTYPVSFAKQNLHENVNVKHAISDSTGSQSISHNTLDGSITVLSSGNVKYGDINCDGYITLLDVILALRICGALKSDSNIICDTNAYHHIGLKEAISFFKILKETN